VLDGSSFFAAWNGLFLAFSSVSAVPVVTGICGGGVIAGWRPTMPDGCPYRELRRGFRNRSLGITAISTSPGTVFGITPVLTMSSVSVHRPELSQSMEQLLSTLPYGNPAVGGSGNLVISGSNRTNGHFFNPGRRRTIREQASNR